jgi:ABC-2 type transport system permease protein
MFQIAAREFRGLALNRVGYVVMALLLMGLGLIFQGKVIGAEQGPPSSSVALAGFFRLAFGFTAIAGVLITMRLFAEESLKRTLVLLTTAPVSDMTVVMGKWLAAVAFCCVFLGFTAVMPLQIVLHGEIEISQVMAGYFGLVMVAMLCSAIGLLGSSISRSQFVAAIVSLLLVGFLVTSWWLAKRVDPPLDSIFEQMAIFDRHFGHSLAKGVLHLRDVVYYLSATGLTLMVTAQILRMKRWA